MISILMPARDAAGTLAEALASIESQTCEDWELIVVDDGSRDDTPAILGAWAARDGRLRVLREGESLGIVAALNRALAEARGEIIARMDADDVALPERLARQRERLAAGDGVAAVGCRVRYFPEE